ncbi:MAG: flagellar biosynthesis anti-sigma factor FlgM [Myxococcales bacterium]|nr:flagellar biosynthesis anti-sigma factor FlgM [Myxococcales bacterium]
MKIGSLPPVNPVDGSAQQPKSNEGETTEADKVTLSKDADFVAEMRQRASSAPFRQDIVEEVKAQLAHGTFEPQTNLQRVVDGLLADL